MWRAAVAGGVLVAALLAACGGDGDDGGADGARMYDEYVELAKAAGKEPMSREDAGINAALVCDEETGGDYFNGVPITEFPTDYAVVRAYCPDRVDELGG